MKAIVLERREALAFLTVSAVAGIAGWALSSYMTSSSGDSRGLRSAQLADLEGKSHSLSEWGDRVLVVNFWATWCAPCREEIPTLMQSREKLRDSGVEFIGIAIDQAAKVAEFVRSLRISYPVLLAGTAAFDILRDLGNPSGGLPFTVVLDRKGGIAHRHLGVVTQQKIEQQVHAALAV